MKAACAADFVGTASPLGPEALGRVLVFWFRVISVMFWEILGFGVLVWICGFGDLCMVYGGLGGVFRILQGSALGFLISRVQAVTGFSGFWGFAFLGHCGMGRVCRLPEAFGGFRLV